MSFTTESIVGHAAKQWAASREKVFQEALRDKFVLFSPETIRQRCRLLIDRSGVETLQVDGRAVLELHPFETALTQTPEGYRYTISQRFRRL